MSGNNGELWNAMFEALADHIEHTRDDNDIRYDYWKLMSNRNWTNSDMDKLTDGAVDYLYLESSNYRESTPIGRVVKELAEKWVVMDISDMVINDRELCRSLDRDILRECERSAKEMDLILRDIERAKREESTRSRSDRGRDRDDRGSRSSRDDRGGRGRDDRSSRGSTRGNAFAFSGRSTTEDSARPARGSGFAGAVSRTEEKPRRSERDEEPAEVSRVATAVRSAGRTTDQSRADTRRSKIDGPDFTLARPYDEFWVDGECWRPAYRSGWKLQEPQGEFAAIETAFNPRKKIRFHVKDQNENIREELSDMNQTSDYLRHELAERTPYRARVTNPEEPQRVIPENPGFQAPRELPAESPVITRAALGRARLVAENVLSLTSIEEAEMFAQFEHNKNGLTQSTSVLNFTIASPVTVVDPENLHKLREVANSINLTDAAERLNACIDKVDPAAWEYVNKRISKLVTDVLRNHYGLGVTLHDFAGKYADLIAWMRGKDEALARSFSIFTRYIPLAACSELDEAAAREWICSTLSMTPEDYDKYRPVVMVFQSAYSVAAVNFTVTDMSVRLESKPQKLDSLEYPQLYALLESVLTSAAQAGLEGQVVYLLTRDRHRVEVIRAPNDNTQLILRLLDV